MKCPHCSKSVGIFSKEMNTWVKKQCPHCQEPVMWFFDLKVGAILLVPAILLGVFLRPIFVNLGLPGALGSGLLSMACLLFAMRLKPVQVAQ
jgi:hypothetical protein